MIQDKQKITEVLATLDGVRILPCRIIRDKDGELGILNNKGSHGKPTEKLFMHASGNIYRACEKHLYVYLEYLHPKGGWKEFFL